MPPPTEPKQLAVKQQPYATAMMSPQEHSRDGNNCKQVGPKPESIPDPHLFPISPITPRSVSDAHVMTRSTSAERTVPTIISSYRSDDKGFCIPSPVTFGRQQSMEYHEQDYDNISSFHCWSSDGSGSGSGEKHAEPFDGESDGDWSDIVSSGGDGGV